MSIVILGGNECMTRRYCSIPQLLSKFSRASRVKTIVT